MEIKSILIKDTTREERIRIVQEGLNQCGGACDFCNDCDNLGGGSVDAFMSHISTAKRSCGKSMRNTGAIPAPSGRWQYESPGNRDLY